MHAMEVFPTEMGWVGALVSPQGVVRISLPAPDEGAALTQLLAGWEEEPPQALSTPLLADLRSRLERFYRGEEVALDPPLDLSAHPSFYQRAWAAVREIPWGATHSYGEVALRLRTPGAARAVGTAMAANPVPPVIPCHRVLRSDGSLGGFGGGLAMKRRMLQNEGSWPRTTSTP